MPGFDWYQPVQVRFGAGCMGEVAAALGDRRVVVVAFPHARASGLAQRLQAQLGERLALWVDCPDSISSVTRAEQLAQQVWPVLAQHAGCVLLAIGGGTTLDLAKVARCRPLDGSFASIAAALRAQAPWPAMALADLWLVPTTAGTGSEVTRWATVWDTDIATPGKRSLDEPFGFAQRAFVDPELSLSCPVAVTRDSAIDALAHALEAIWNRHANPVSDALAVTAARSILHSLPLSLQAPQDLELRSAISLAALQAGLAFSQTRTALAHALSYALTLEQGLPHGLACAVWLPTAWRLAVGRDARTDQLLASVFGCSAAAGAEQLCVWLRRMGIDADPAAFGLRDADARIHAALTSARGRNFVGAAA